MLQRPAFILGWLGLLPAVAAVVAAGLGAQPLRELAFRAGALYAGLILSFLGGAWWGLAARARERAWLLYGVAVVPSLAALALLLLMDAPGVILMGVLILSTLLVDRALDGFGLTPANWMRLRVPLSVGLGAATILLGILALPRCDGCGG
jgi:hypothetical protein